MVYASTRFLSVQIEPGGSGIIISLVPAVLPCIKGITVQDLLEAKAAKM